jgi:uncharacterized protein YoxC
MTKKVEEKVKAVEEKVKDHDAILDALKELTTAIADLKKEQVKLSEEIKTKVKAGRF